MKTTDYNSMEFLQQRKDELLEAIRGASECLEMAAGYEMNDVRNRLMDGVKSRKSGAEWALINVQNQIDGV